MIKLALPRMSPQQERLWQMIRIQPAKWAKHTHGEEGGGFWVVAAFGTKVVWYNDIEEGFNRSRYRERGIIAEYWAEQDDLIEFLTRLLHQINADSGV